MDDPGRRTPEGWHGRDLGSTLARTQLLCGPFARCEDKDALGPASLGVF